MKKQLSLKNGETISYFDVGSNEEVVLLLHGNFSSNISFEKLMNDLGKEYRVIAPNLRGFGDSTYFRKINKVADYSEDIFSFLTQLGITKINVIGWAFGGAVAMDLTANYQGLVNKLVLLNSVPHTGMARFKRNEKGSEIFGSIYSSVNELKENDPIFKLIIDDNNNLKTEDIMKFLSNSKHTINQLDSKEEEILISQIKEQRSLADNIWALANFNMSHQHNFYSSGTNTINNIQIPVLHIWGESDDIIKEHMVLQNLYALKEISSYIKYNDCGHNPMIDKKNQLSKDIIEFLKK